MSTRDAARLEQLYHDEGLTQAEIGRELGITQAAVSRRMRRAGVGTRAVGRASDGGRTALAAALRPPDWGGTAAAHRGDECETCGSTGRLEVHHVVPLVAGGAPDHPGNLMTVCPPCHRSAHRVMRRNGVGALEVWS
jgi:5-methylcytosine-specific restriction endonuclease McrA